MRYERKYRIEDVSFFEIRQLVIESPFSFQEAFPDRWVNSIYLDTPSFSALSDNLDGISKRIKYRIRWYGPDYLSGERPVLEKKIKNNQLGSKEKINLPDFQLNNNFDFNNYINQNTPITKDFDAKVMTRYCRSYFTTQDQLFRLTIDRNLQYYLFNGNLRFTGFPVKDPAIIIELKYEDHLAEKAEEILQYLPFRLTKNSKYVYGVAKNYF